MSGPTEALMKKKLMIWAAGVIAAAGLAGEARAANPASMTLKVTVNVALSVSLSDTQYDFGLMGANQVAVSTRAITVANDSNGRTEDFTIDGSTFMASGGANWNISGTTGAFADTFSLCAKLDSVAPSSGTFANGDCLDATAANQQNMDATHFAGDQNGNNVTAAGTRSLWFRLGTPTTITGGSNVQQTATVTVTANDASTF